LLAPSSFAGIIGLAREDITPPVGIYARNWGAATHDVAGGIHRPLTATVLTLQTHDESPLVLAALDLGWWRSRDDEWWLRGEVLSACNLEPAQLMICLSHTHAGPVLHRGDADKPGGNLIAPYLQQVRDALIRAIKNALQNRQRAVLGWQQGKSTLATNRDLRDPDQPRFLCGFHPGAPADDTLLVGRVTNHNGQVTGTLVNYACHPTTLGPGNSLISPDYIGALRETVEEYTKAPCLFLQGASGELAPREQYVADTNVADTHGRQLGYAILSVLEGALRPTSAWQYSGTLESGAPLAIWQHVEHQPPTTLQTRCVDVTLPLKAMPSAVEIEQQLSTCPDRAQAERLRRKLQVRRAVGDGTSTKIPAYIWRIGDAFLVGQPNEAYSNLQTVLRAAFPDRSVAVMNVVNGWYGYLPPQDLYDEDLYAVWQTPFERGSLETLIQACRHEIDALL
jgi:hypothetical protein